MEVKWIPSQVQYEYVLIVEKMKSVHEDTNVNGTCRLADHGHFKAFTCPYTKLRTLR